MHDRSAATESAELTSGLGALVPRAGLALVLPEWLRSYASPLLIGGVLVHGVGMTLKYRLERRDGRPPWWQQALFWLCWACLAALGLWLVAAFVTARERALDFPTMGKSKLRARPGERDVKPFLHQSFPLASPPR